jgi:SAM-dependent methyltransferase
MPRPTLYIFDDPDADQHRLLLQAELFRAYLTDHAPAFLPTPPTRILDLGCGFGHLTLALHDLYPTATVVGVDRNPDAIAVARQHPLLPPSVSFVVGDIQEALPPGPFDLIYASLVLVHVPALARVVAHIAAALAPGGTVWVKDLHQGFVAQSTDPDYQTLWQETLAAVAQIGGHPTIETDLPPLLLAAGLTDLRVAADETYPLGGATLDGEICLADAIAVFRNTRPLVSAVRGIPAAVLEQRCDRLTARAQSGAALGAATMINILARRPRADE